MPQYQRATISERSDIVSDHEKTSFKSLSNAICPEGQTLAAPGDEEVPAGSALLDPEQAKPGWYAATLSQLNAVCGGLSEPLNLRPNFGNVIRNIYLLSGILPHA